MRITGAKSSQQGRNMVYTPKERAREEEGASIAFAIKLPPERNGRSLEQGQPPV